MERIGEDLNTSLVEQIAPPPPSLPTRRRRGLLITYNREGALQGVATGCRPCFSGEGLYGSANTIRIPSRPFRTNTQKRCPFHYRGLECKSRKSRDTWSNRQVGLGAQNEAGQRLMEFCKENALVIANTLFQQHKRRLYMDITRWSTLKSD